MMVDKNGKTRFESKKKVCRTEVAIGKRPRGNELQSEPEGKAGLERTDPLAKK